MSRTPKAILILVVAAASVASLASPAQALIPQAYSTSFAGSGANALNAPRGVAVDDSTGEVYVADTGNNRVSKFTAAGAFVLMFGEGVNQTTGGDICTAASGDVCQPGADTDTPGGFTDPRFLVVDDSGGPSDGSVYVGDAATKLVQKFGPNGALVTSWASGGQLDGSGPLSGAALNQVSGLAIEGGGTLVVSGRQLRNSSVESVLLRYTPDGTFISNLQMQVSVDTIAFGLESGGTIYLAANDGIARFLQNGGLFDSITVSGPTGLAIDTGDDDVYVGNGSTIFQFEPSCGPYTCAPAGSFGAGNLTGATGLGVNTVDHSVYAADTAANEIDVFVAPPPAAPDLIDQAVAEVHAESAVLAPEINPGGRPTTYELELGPADCSLNACPVVATGFAGAGYDSRIVEVPIDGLSPNTTYHFRFTVESSEGIETGPDRLLVTYPLPAGGADPCPNALSRKQTGARALLDCRSYELVSAPNTNGYNVESDLVGGQQPYGGYPAAPGRAIYAINNGGVPGIGNPPNRGPAPYLATRSDEEGWSTEYVGLPADIQGEAEPFSSTLLEADSGLRTFAFGGPDICDPCFDDGSSGLPLRLADGDLVQGMAGPDDPGPGAEPAGEVTRHFSGDGTHFVFSSTDRFHPAGNDNGTDVTIYDRNLSTGVTQVASTMQDGTTMTGPGIVELDVSEDGSRILVGQVVGTDSAGNDRYDLYMHVGTSPASVPVVDTPSGVLYAGMTADGTTVYFTTPDVLDGDGDSSVDLFRADVGTGGASVTRVSTGSGGTGDTDSCSPTANSAYEDWNSPDAAGDCSVLAIAGGGGVAPETGAIYFLSPEQLDDGSDAVQDRPNLYRAEPGSQPRFVTTLESAPDGPTPPLSQHTFTTAFGSFTNAVGAATAPNGDLYVMDLGDVPPLVERYTPAGDFVSANDGSGTPAGSFGIGVGSLAGTPSGIAVDPATGDLYVPNPNAAVVYKFNDAGAYVSQEAASSQPVAVAISPLDGNHYIARNGGLVRINDPAGGQVGLFGALAQPRAIAIDSAGRVYVGNAAQTLLFSSTGSLIRTVASGPAFGITVDPTNDDVYINQGNRILHLRANGDPVPVSGGTLTAGRGVALGDDARLFAVQSGAGGDVQVFDEALAPDPRTDNPAIIHALEAAGERNTADFQVTASGDHAAFISTRQLTGLVNGQNPEVYRYDAVDEEIECASCNPTGAAGASGSTMARDGLSITDDGRVFFTTAKPIALRDKNSKKDVYEWNEGQVELISSGTSLFDSGLLSTTADGRDAFFFTTDTLAPEDKNGTTMKLYDAREKGGFFVIRPPGTCKASDECHGPGSPAPALRGITTTAGHPGNLERVRCKRGFVKKNGKCVKRKKKRKSKRRKQRTHRATRGNR